MATRGRKPGGPKSGGGSRKGVPNKLNRDLKEMILGALHAEGGQEYLQTQANKNPTAFMTLLGKVLPTTLAGDPNHPLQIGVIQIPPKAQ